jgi:MFS family permease
MKYKDKQIFKFGLYGFFKNLRLFDPVLLMYLYQSDVDVFEIGLLYSIREIIVYVFEIPSGVLADRYGKRNELVLCFVFYIISFVLFALGGSFLVFTLAMMLFGLGEAFRSGTHKAMIMDYLDLKKMKDEKSKIYGFTRSYSMIGSMLSSIILIGLLIYELDVSFLFIIAIVPYVIDILLILSYPDELNQKTETSFQLRSFFQANKDLIRYSVKEKKVRYTLLSSSTYQAFFKVLKDFVQLILLSAPLPLLIFTNKSDDTNVKIISALLYVVIYMFSAIASRKAHLVQKYLKTQKATVLLYLLTGVTAILIGAFTHLLWVVFALFILLHILMNIRKPIIVDLFGEYTSKDQRAGVLSADSQLTSLLLIVFAPLIGYIAKQISISASFIMTGSIMILLVFLSLKMKDNGELHDRV